MSRATDTSSDTPGLRHTLLFRLAGPMQSWGVQSRFSVRDTGMEPSKSGVVGLLCAALGRPRQAPIDDLAALVLGVRVDREGTKRYDYQTAGQDGFLRARGKVESTNVIPSERYYLSDAAFLVGLEGDDLDLLHTLDAALRAPHWPLSLGRKAFPPGEPLPLPDSGVRPHTPLLHALIDHPWRRRPRQSRPDTLRYVLEQTGDRSLPNDAVVRMQPDQPLSFRPRRFTSREVIVTWHPLPQHETPNSLE